MAHRGPDAAHTVFLDSGKIGLGHRRLSIIDLSEAADQPMRRGDLWIVYNGEIYNFRELRAELEQKGHTFSTQSDTEVLLAGYEEWGVRLCDRLQGMFAFVIWDDKQKKLFGARDHVGQKPFYYYAGRRVLIIASELPAITTLVEGRLSVRWESIPDLLYYGYVPEPYTWFGEVKTLLPGHYVEATLSNSDEHHVRVAEYWGFRPDPDPRPISAQQALDIVGTEIAEAVRSHLIADVEVGAFLSGGVDSTCVAAVTARTTSRSIKTFCIGMGGPDANEAPQAQRTAAWLGTQHYQEYIPAFDFRVPPETALHLFGQPFSDYSFVPTQLVARLARKHVKCALTGDGGDEVWGGYAHHPTYVQFPRGSLSSWRDIVRFLAVRLRGRKAWQNRLNIGHVMVNPEQVRACLSPEFSMRLKDYDVTWYVRQHWDENLDPFRRAQWADIKTYLVSDILVKVDRCAMRESLETRPPFLSRRLIEKIMDLPTEIKNPGGALKGLFKAWLRGRVPDEVLRVRKRGFGVPTSQFPGRDAATYRLPKCVAAGVVTRELVPLIGRLPLTSWKFEMIEAAL